MNRYDNLSGGIIMTIGEQIHRLRKENNLTQEELADRSELTKGYISQIERDLSSPSIATLVDILEALGTNISDFFSENPEEKIVFTNEDWFEKVEENYTIEWVIPNAQKNEMEPIIITLAPNGHSSFDEPHHGEEFGYVLQGSIQVLFGNKKYVVKKGQTFYFSAKYNHQLINASKTSPAKILWVVTPPTF